MLRLLDGHSVYSETNEKCYGDIFSKAKKISRCQPLGVNLPVSPLAEARKYDGDRGKHAQINLV